MCVCVFLQRLYYRITKDPLLCLVESSLPCLFFIFQKKNNTKKNDKKRNKTKKIHVTLSIVEDSHCYIFLSVKKEAVFLATLISSIGGFVSSKKNKTKQNKTKKQ